MYARVCKENKKELQEELEKNNAYWNNFAVNGASLKEHTGEVGDISRWYSQGWVTIT